MALMRLRRLEESWNDVAVRESLLAECRAWMAEQNQVPRLCNLARLLQPGISLRQLWSVLVPVERAVARLRVTDVEILSADLPPQERPHGAVLPLTIVLDSIRSAFNVGGILRTAECFGASEVVFCGYTPLPDQAQVARAALGAEKLVKWRYVNSALQAVTELQRVGVPCVALETVAGVTTIDKFVWPWPCALVVGNERFGLGADVVELCAHATRIELAGCKNSLNVVSALAVALFVARQRGEITGVIKR